MQLHAPARVLAILGLQGCDGRRAQAGEAPDVAAQAALQCRHRIGHAAGGVVPALERGHPEVDIEAGERMAPDLGGKCLQGGVQGTGFRWCGQQRANDREAQARPAIPC